MNNIGNHDATFTSGVTWQRSHHDIMRACTLDNYRAGHYGLKIIKFSENKAALKGWNIGNDLSEHFLCVLNISGVHHNNGRYLIGLLVYHYFTCVKIFQKNT